MNLEPSFSFNGVTTTLKQTTTVEDLVRSAVPTLNGCAVARNGDVVPRSDWGTVVIQDNDVIELLTVAQGG